VGPAGGAEVREDRAPRTQYLSHLRRPNFALPWARRCPSGPHVMGALAQRCARRGSGFIMIKAAQGQAGDTSVCGGQTGRRKVMPTWERLLGSLTCTACTSATCLRFPCFPGVGAVNWTETRAARAQLGPARTPAVARGSARRVAGDHTPPQLGLGCDRAAAARLRLRGRHGGTSRSSDTASPWHRQRLLITGTK
jgi:hypothetical protein